MNLQTTKSFRNVERRITLAFGALILLLMIIVLFAGGFYLQGVMEREENKLSTLLTQVLANSVSRISFSGKYHARLLLEELKATQPKLDYLLLAESNGQVLAHSDPLLNDTTLSSSTIAIIQAVIKNNGKHVRYFSHNNESIREVTLPYLGGFNNTIVGAIQVGLSTQSRHQAVTNGVIYIAFVVAGLLLIGVLITYRISTYFGNPIKQLASDMEATLHAIPDVLFELDENGRYVQVLTHNEKLLARSKNKLLNRYVEEILPNKAAKTVLNALKEAKYKGDSHGHQICLPLSQGNSWYELSVAKKAGLKDGKNHFIVLSREISQRKLVEQEIITLNSKLEERVEQRSAELKIALEEATHANTAKSEFLSSMSHELRTPMNAILGFAQLLQLDKTLNKAQKTNTQEILNAGTHLLTLINEVLDLSKVESGHIDLSIEAVNVFSAIEECIGLVSPLAEKRGISINHNNVDGVMVKADSTRFKQSLLNLLSNAIKYNREDGEIQITFKTVDKNQLCISIIDSGLGIPPEQLTELFKPFNRFNADKTNIEGTGIGLTLSKRLIELMGGSLEVESKVGTGSIFSITLAIEINIPPEIEAEAEKQQNNSEQLLQKSNNTQHKILYIEDNPANLNLVEQILAHREHIQLITSETPASGIELAKTHKPELILLDINLPGMDGYQVLKVFKADKNLVNIPVIAVTAMAMLSDIERGKAEGFIDYVTKPLDIKEFLITIDKYLSSNGYS